MLIQYLAQVRYHRRLVGITGVSDHFKKIFKMVGITKFADIYDNIENGVEGLSEAPCPHTAAC